MKNLEKLPIPLLEWYQDNRRSLPWRDQPSPYRVWVSEIMLQQTRVAAVLGYFDRFMAALPTIEDLASVSEDELLKLWQGLGYYSRARNLQKAAKQIMADFGGIFPQEYAAIRSLAGIGDYTASAISSIVFGLPYPAVDGNLLRVSARIAGDDGDVTTPAMKKKVTLALGEIIPLQAPGAFNQAMMDLGATICLPNGAPLCQRCPAKNFCVAYQKNLTGVLPVRKAKKARRVEQRTVLLLFHKGSVALRRRPPRGLLASLWEFPNALEGEETPLLDTFSLSLPPGHAGLGKHIFSHVEWHMQAFVVERSSPTLPEGFVWADRAELNDTYAIPTAFSFCNEILDAYL